MKELPGVVKKDDTIFLNDGLIQLRVDKVESRDIRCTVMLGGPLQSRKGVNIPGIDLGVSAFTAHDRDYLRFALENGAMLERLEVKDMCDFMPAAWRRESQP